MAGPLRWAALLALSLGACSDGNEPNDEPPTPDTPSGSEVLVRNDVFTPSTSTVPVGGTLTWTWQSNGAEHSVQFEDGGPSSAVQGSGSFSRAFPAPGSLPYHCTVHPTIMTGVVNVGQGGTGDGGGAGEGGDDSGEDDDGYP